MKILVIGLSGAAPELLLDDDRLKNIRRVMEAGCWGRLKSVTPSTVVPAWLCMSTGRNPGSLGVYGLRNRRDRSYDSFEVANSAEVSDVAIWDHAGREGARAILIGVPPSYPPLGVNGVSVGCHLTPEGSKNYAHPLSARDEIDGIAAGYAPDIGAAERKFGDERLVEAIYENSRKRFAVVRHFLAKPDWDYFQVVDAGLDRIQRAFWQFHDAEHSLYEPGTPFSDVIRDYYLYLDEEIGAILGTLRDDTAVLVASAQGAKRIDGGFCINEWLVEEGLLSLDEYPGQMTPFERLNVNWERTSVWGAADDGAGLFFNVRGREPRGKVDPADYERLRDDVKERLNAALAGETAGGPVVMRPEEIYGTARGIPPDLIMNFGQLRRRPIGDVGCGSSFADFGYVGREYCNHAPYGAFVLAATNSPLEGEIDGAELLDIAPTLLELGGYEVPAAMEGSSLFGGDGAAKSGFDEEQMIRDRLSGLGYI